MGLFDFLRRKQPASVLEPLDIPPAAGIAPGAENELDLLCAEYGATYERERRGPAAVVIRLKWPNGDVVSGWGANTADAIAHLRERVQLMRAPR